MSEPTGSVAEKGVLLLSETEWQEAKRRADVIQPLAEQNVISHARADAAAIALGLSRRAIYLLVSRWRCGEGLVTDLAKTPNHGGKDKTRLPAAKERIIAEALEHVYLSRQRRSIAVLMREIRKQSRLLGMHPPALSTVTRRIASLGIEDLTKRRYGVGATRRLRAAGGTTPQVSVPMDVVQIDHTVIDVVVVDPASRQPIGRPYLTIAIDEFSRCIVGLVVTLEAPSAVSVGLCLAHAATPKIRSIERLGVDANWPMHGIPRSLYLDNASEFKSEALRRGCEQYGIALHYRPVACPNYGGIVERVIGTVMKWVHELPGTTFSNPVERDSFASEKTAALTMIELERWMTLAICGVYHEAVHASLGQSPSAKWSAGVSVHGMPKAVSSPDSFLIDFLPVIRRSLGRSGFVIDRVAYFSNALTPWIVRRHEMGRFVLRRNPLDISRIWVLDGDTKTYLEVPYRTLSNPPITIWEHRSAMGRLRSLGNQGIDEAMIFRTIDKMREIATQAAKSKRRARRDVARREHLGQKRTQRLDPPRVIASDRTIATPFKDIEEW